MNVPQLCALLMNPPQTSGRLTRRHIDVAARILGCEMVVIGNLFAVPTATVLDINKVGVAEDGWYAARSGLTSAIAHSDHILAAWGVSGLHGAAAANFTNQVDWLLQIVTHSGHSNVWTLRGETRHPSRWHQYVSDRHGRASGASFEERLRSALIRETVAQLRLKLCLSGNPGIPRDLPGATRAVN